MRKQFITLPIIGCLLACPATVHADEPRSFLPQVEKESLTFRSSSSPFQLSFNGRIQADGALFFGEDYQPIGNGVGFRRVRLGADLSFGEQLSGKIEMDLTDGEFSLKDCFIRYTFGNGLYLRAGNFKESFGMDAMTSSGDLMLMEKANVSSVFAPEFHIGVQAAWQQNQFLGAAGVHFKRIGGSKEKEAAEYNNKNGVDEGISYTARGVWMPVAESKEKGIHVGLSASFRTPKTSVGTDMPNTVRYNARSLSNINRIKFLDTGPISSVRHDWLAGAELGAFYQNFRLQGEYVLNHTSRMESLPTEKFNGFYLQAACLLFGGKQQYSTSRGAFAEPSFGRSWGDVELAARFDRLDLNGNLIHGGLSNGLTLGTTYYANRHLKVQLNYSYVTHDLYANAFGSAAVGLKANGDLAYHPEDVVGGGGNDYSILSVRFQLKF